MRRVWRVLCRIVDSQFFWDSLGGIVKVLFVLFVGWCIIMAIKVVERGALNIIAVFEANSP